MRALLFLVVFFFGNQTAAQIEMDSTGHVGIGIAPTTDSQLQVASGDAALAARFTGDVQIAGSLFFLSESEGEVKDIMELIQQLLAVAHSQQARIDALEQRIADLEASDQPSP